jgi:hypothetical protein
MMIIRTYINCSSYQFSTKMDRHFILTLKAISHKGDKASETRTKTPPTLSLFLSFFLSFSLHPLYLFLSFFLSFVLCLSIFLFYLCLLSSFSCHRIFRLCFVSVFLCLNMFYYVDQTLEMFYHPLNFICISAVSLFCRFSGFGVSLKV